MKHQTGLMRGYGKYFISYCLLIIVSFLLMLPVAVEYTNLAEERTAVDNQVRIEQGVAAMDAQFKSILATVQDLIRLSSVNSTLTTLRLEKDQYLELSKVQFLINNLTHVYPYITDYALIGGNGVIYSNGRSFANRTPMHDMFFDLFLQIEGDVQLESCLESQEGGVFCAKVVSIDNGTYDALVCHTSLYSFPSLNRAASLLFFVDLRTLMKNVLPQALLGASYCTLTDGAGRILYTDVPEHLDTAQYQSVTAQSFLGCSLNVLYERRIISASVQPLLRMLWINLALDLVVGLLVALYLSWRAHHPISLLMQAVSHSPGTEQHSGPVDELEYVAREFDSLQSRLQENEKQLIEQKKRISRSVLEHAVFGYLSVSYGTDYFFELFPDFPESYCAALLAVESQDSEDRLIQALSRQATLEKMIHDSLRTEYILSLSPSTVFVVMDTRAMGDARARLEKLTAALTDRGIRITAAVSGAHTGVLQLNEAYNELLYIMRHNGACQPGQVAQMNSVEMNSSMSFDYNILQQLYRAILDDEKETISIQFNRMRTAYGSGAMNGAFSADGKQRIAQYVQPLLMRVKHENYTSLGETDIPLLSNEDSAEEYLQRSERCALQMAERLNENQRPKQKALADEVIEYLDLNICSEDLYLPGVVERFGITEKVLQEIMRQKTGASFLEYIDRQRVRIAYQLLTTTDLSVGEVARKVGIPSYNTFYKMFKRYYFQSPSECRDAKCKGSAGEGGA